MCALAQMLARDELITPPTYACAMMGPTTIASKTQTLTSAGFETAQAANMAIIHAHFQVMEALSVRQHGTGQVIFTDMSLDGYTSVLSVDYSDKEWGACQKGCLQQKPIAGLASSGCTNQLTS